MCPISVNLLTACTLLVNLTTVKVVCCNLDGVPEKNCVVSYPPRLYA